MIEIESLSYHAGGTQILRDVSTRLARGGITALIGPNGAGKSTLLHCISGLEHPSAGSVRIDGMEADNRAQHHLSKGTQILIATPGGGGYGRQKDRDNEHVSRDKRLGYVEEDQQ